MLGTQRKIEYGEKMGSGRDDCYFNIIIFVSIVCHVVPAVSTAADAGKDVRKDAREEFVQPGKMSAQFEQPNDEKGSMAATSAHHLQQLRACVIYLYQLCATAATSVQTWHQTINTCYYILYVVHAQ